MGEKTAIAWADATHNFWMGCRKVSQGCKHCYAERQMTGYGRSFTLVTRAKDFGAPLKWKEGRRIFTCSWSDFFIQEADPWRAEAWDIIRRTPQHTYLILTKRPERILESLPAGWDGGWPNVWLGVSIETTGLWDRLVTLVNVPAQVHFLSLEPLLGPIPLSDWLTDPWPIEWVIVGGESGPQYRPMQMAWARDLRDQCVLAGVPFFFKQQAGARPGMAPYLVEEDGRQTTWQQFPKVEAPPVPPIQQALF